MVGLGGRKGNAVLAKRFPVPRLRPPFSVTPPETGNEKGPAVSDGPLGRPQINWGTNELNFADYGGAVNISDDRLAVVQTNAGYSPRTAARRVRWLVSQHMGTRTMPCSDRPQMHLGRAAWPRALSWAAGGMPTDPAARYF